MEIDQEKKKHLLLLVIELPFRFIMWSWNILNFVFGLPLYGYFILMQGFLTSENFTQSVAFIIFLSPFRILCFLLSLTIPLLESYGIIKLILIFTANKLTLILTSCALCLLTFALSWFGLYKLAKRSHTFTPFYKFEKAIKDSIYFIISMPFTIMVFLMLFRIYKVIKYKQPKNPIISIKDYCVFIIWQWIKSIIIIVFLPFNLILILLPWRLWETCEVLKKPNSIKSKLYILLQAVQTLIDFILCPLPALIVFLTLYRLPKLVRKLDPKKGTRY